MVIAYSCIDTYKFMKYMPIIETILLLTFHVYLYVFYLIPLYNCSIYSLGFVLDRNNEQSLSCL